MNRAHVQSIDELNDKLDEIRETVASLIDEVHEEMLFHDCEVPFRKYVLCLVTTDENILKAMSSLYDAIRRSYNA